MNNPKLKTQHSTLMITQDVLIDRRIVLQARTLTEAGWNVTILARAAAEATAALNLPAKGDEWVDGIRVQRIKVEGQDPRYGWVYRLGRVAGARGQKGAIAAAALLGVLNGYNTFSRLAPHYAAAMKADVYHAHDLVNLQAAALAALINNSALVYDAHELFPEINNRWVRLKKRYWSKVERLLLPKCDAASTVNEFIADEMAGRYHVPPPIVIYNATNPPPGFDPANPPNHLREALGLGRETRIALFQGWMAEGRGLENLVLSAKHLPTNVVVVMLGFGLYRNKLEQMAQSAGLTQRVRFLDAVPQSKLVEYCASADVGLIPYQAVDLNNFYSSPNKLFDYIVAGLPIIANDLPFLRKMVVGHGLGLTAALDSPASYASAISLLLGNDRLLRETRANLLAAAKIYNWDEEGKKVVRMYEGLNE
jgi:glycosyltransferase involved in cell wall biosynthesis